MDAHDLSVIYYRPLVKPLKASFQDALSEFKVVSLHLQMMVISNLTRRRRWNKAPLTKTWRRVFRGAFFRFESMYEIRY